MNVRNHLSILSHDTLLEVAVRLTEAACESIKVVESHGSVRGVCRKASGILQRALPEGVNAAGEVEQHERAVR